MNRLRRSRRQEEAHQDAMQKGSDLIPRVSWGATGQVRSRSGILAAVWETDLEG